jgi:LmbE family N-acetylglucosaminyl deacetylase
VLVLSPHLDDAVLSCSGYMQRMQAEGARVVIASVFTEGDPRLYQTRRREDRCAAALLGASVRHLGFLDAPYRSAKHRDFCGIAFGRARDYAPTRRAVACEIASLFDRLRPQLVIAPMAVGNHVDHRIVRDAALAAVDSARLRFYEDRPYAFLREQVRHSLGYSMAQQPPAFWKRYFRTSYVRSYLGNTDPEQVIQGWSRVPPFPRPLKPYGRVTSGALAALAEYRSQLADLFASETEMVSLYRKVPETLYTISPS